MSKREKTTYDEFINQLSSDKREKIAEQMSKEFEQNEKYREKYFQQNKDLIMKYFKFPRVVDVDMNKQRKSPVGFALMSEKDMKHLKKATVDNVQEKMSAVELQKHLNQRGKNINVDEMMQQKLSDKLKPLNKKFLSKLTGGKRKTRKRKRKRRRKKTRRRKRGKKTYKKRKKKKHHHTVKFKEDKCSPKKQDNILKFTCYTKDSLFKLKEIWNARHKDNKIISNDPKTIWGFLHTHMSNTCNRESCWLKKNWIKAKLPKKLQQNTFAPKQPEVWKRKPNEWLTSIDILNVMKQYELTYKNFEFMGPSPIDFDTHKLYGECVWEELCKFRLKEQIKNKKTKVGVIFNLDRHHEPGSHWVALFIDIKKKEIYYFDSYADDPPKEIERLVSRIQKESIGFGKKYKFIKNNRRHQWSNSECGMYCLYFIISLIKGANFNKFEKKRVDDKFMKKLRNIYFNKI